ncbi:hypothetical protein AB0M02_32055 [Actinoplanes sp. NPDC051861]|uniref:hypothetical protein n=1 Tax=Actinoplanes sp. NPDC051861 TaxID=3155170 RepID=UPI00342EA274
MKRFLVAVTATAGLIVCAACGDEPPTRAVPTLSASASASASAGADAGTGGNEDPNPNAVAGDASAERRARLHAAAECVRQHGAAQYQDPLLTADGYVYTDEVALRSLDEAAMEAIDAACRDLIRAANFSMRDQGPPPPRLIQAGVRSAECFRANGLPDYRDPTADSRFSPGKGFGLDSEGIPAAGKQDPTVRRALETCRAILDEEAAVSSLGNLGDA